MSTPPNYLKEELYELVQADSSIFEFLQAGALDGIWYWDLEHPEHEWMSPRFWTTLGYDPDTMKHLASEWQDLINPDDLQVALENFKRHCADPDHPYDQVVRYRHRDGSTVWVRCRGMAIRDDEGNCLRMLGAHTDLTAQKRAEEALVTKTEELEEVNRQLQEALESIKTLQGLFPICSYCKKVRDDEGYWSQIEAYVSERSEAEFSHGICPECEKKHFGWLSDGDHGKPEETVI
jgi:PAS domain S-box-containing protein